MNRSDRLDAIFFALSDPTRRAILARLTVGPTSVLELARPFRMTQPAVTKHLRVLERAGLVSQYKESRQRPRRLEFGALDEIETWLAPYRPHRARLDSKPKGRT